MRRKILLRQHVNLSVYQNSAAAARIPFWMHELQLAKEAGRAYRISNDFGILRSPLEAWSARTLRVVGPQCIWLTGGKNSGHMFLLLPKYAQWTPASEKEEKFLDLERGRDCAKYLYPTSKLHPLILWE